MLLLLPLIGLAGCQTLLTTPSTGTTAAIVAETCRAWLYVPPAPYSASKDTPGTVSGVRVTNLAAQKNNAAREAWGCPK